MYTAEKIPWTWSLWFRPEEWTGLSLASIVLEEPMDPSHEDSCYTLTLTSRRVTIYFVSTKTGSYITNDNAFALFSSICRCSKWQECHSNLNLNYTSSPSLLHTTSVFSFSSRTSLAIHLQFCDTLLSIQTETILPRPIQPVRIFSLYPCSPSHWQSSVLMPQKWKN